MDRADVVGSLSPAPGQTAPVDVASVPGQRRGGLLLWVSAAVALGCVALLAVAVLRPATIPPLRTLHRPGLTLRCRATGVARCISRPCAVRR